MVLMKKGEKSENSQERLKKITFGSPLEAFHKRDPYYKNETKWSPFDLSLSDARLYYDEMLDIVQEGGDPTSCPLCRIPLKTHSIVEHVGKCLDFYKKCQTYSEPVDLTLDDNKRPRDTSASDADVSSSDSEGQSAKKQKMTLRFRTPDLQNLRDDNSTSPNDDSSLDRENE